MSSAVKWGTSEFNRKVGARLRKYREARGLSSGAAVYDFRQRGGGISRTQERWDQFEIDGSCPLTLWEAKIIADQMQISLDALVGRARKRTT